MPTNLAKALPVMLLAVALVACGGAGGSSSTGGNPGPGPVPPPPGPPVPPGPGAPSMVAIIVLENTSYERVIGNSAMPFLNSLVPQGALATQYFADTHPSIGNYFMLTTGQMISNDDAFAGTVSADNIVRELATANKTWKGYFQSIPSPGYTGNDVYPYIHHHDPFSYFTDLVQPPNAAQEANLVPLTQLAADESANSFPNYMFIVPDNEHNAHDCPAGASAICLPNDKLSAADAFLSSNVTPLLNNTTFKQNGVLIIVFDEGDEIDIRNTGGHIVMLAVGAHAKVGFQSTTLYKHENLLRTIAGFLGFTAPGNAATAAPMSDMFQ